MEVLLNGQPLGGELAGGNLQDLLRDLDARWMGAGHSLREVRVNGRAFREAESGPAGLLGREGIARLEVETISQADLARHFLAHGQALLQVVARSTDQVAEMFRVQDDREANEHYLALLESLQLFLHMLEESRSALDLDFGAMQAGGFSAQERLARLTTLLQDLLQAQERQDWVLLADLLQYDLKPELDAWDRLWPDLRGRA